MPPLPRFSAALLLIGSCAAAAWAGGDFRSRLSAHGVGFLVLGSDEGAGQQLTIATEGSRWPVAPVVASVEGRVVGAEAADLDGDGQPEVYVFLEGVGRGGLVGYALTAGHSLSPIRLPELDAHQAQGYRGQDRFELLEGCLVRRFPIHRPTDAGGVASGGERQICYELQAEGSSRSLRPAFMLQVN